MVHILQNLLSRELLKCFEYQIPTIFSKLRNPTSLEFQELELTYKGPINPLTNEKRQKMQDVQGSYSDSC